MEKCVGAGNESAGTGGGAGADVSGIQTAVALPAAVMDAAAVVQLLAAKNVDLAIEEFSMVPAVQAFVRDAASFPHLELSAGLARKYIESYVKGIHSAIQSGTGRDTWFTPNITGPVVSVAVVDDSSSSCQFDLWLELGMQSGGSVVN